MAYNHLGNAGLTHIIEWIVNRLTKKVDKVTGKGLSTNDLTNTLKSNYDTAYSNSHSHRNKSVLDTITADKISLWESGISSTVITGGNWNEVTDVGMYTMKGAGQSNTPDGSTSGYYGLIVVKSDTSTSYFQQIATKKRSQRLWIRHGTGAWREITAAATTSADGMMLAGDKTKLDAIENNANVGFNKIKIVGGNTFPATSTVTGFQFSAGDGITITPLDGTSSGTIFKFATDIADATSSKSGLMPKELADKIKAGVSGYSSLTMNQSSNNASANYGLAINDGTSVTAPAGFACGYQTLAAGNQSFAGGNQTKANYAGAFSIGDSTIANGIYSFASGGYTEANQYQMVIGKYNTTVSGQILSSNTSGSPFVIGKGISDAKANCFRVATLGSVYSTGAYNTSGADYAEYFEWLDGNPDNEDRRGLFVTLDGGKIRIANADDSYILGVVSVNASVVGNSYDDQWQGMYLYDVYGSPMMENIEDIDENGNTIIVQTQKLNPNYDSSKEYIPRSLRKEWSAIGMLGVLIVRDNGDCEVNGYCCVGYGGIATPSDNGYRVLQRLDDTHIKILMK